jgi:hypothetical protein
VGGKDFIFKFAEVMNYIVLIDSGVHAGELAIMSYSIGDLRVGKKLNKLITRRSDKYGASIFDNRIQFSTTLRKRNNREWWGWDHDNPSDGSGAMVTDQARHDYLLGLHDEAARGLKAGAFGVAREDVEMATASDGDDGDLPPI